MKSFRAILFFTVLISVSSLYAQGLEEQTLLTIDGTEYDAGTFMRVYLKNLDIVQDESQKDVDNYLDLYIKYRLKLKQAYKLGLDKEEAYKNELSNYRSSLAQGFLTDIEVTDQLVKEAYNRTTEEVNASHILVKVGKGAAAADTLKAYNRILKIKEELDAGADFATVARNRSEGPSAGNAGELGWFGPFRMVFEFEDAAYNTEVGNYTDPFRTDFGYHILKVNDRRKARGEVTVAHIMAIEKDSDSLNSAEKRINDIYLQLEAGKSFEELAREFSDDLRSSNKGGVLPRFGTGGLNSPEFVDTALAMDEIGAYTAPVQSKYGWHIIKLIEKHPVQTFEKQEKSLREKITKSARARTITESFNKKLRSKYNIDTPMVSEDMLEVIGDSIMQSDWKYEHLPAHASSSLFSIRDSVYSAQEFYEFAEKRQLRSAKANSSKEDKIEDLLDAFVNDKLIKYYDANLERDNEDFAFVYGEFKEGILLFNLMERKLWGAAKVDSIGLRKFYDKNKGEYQWRKRLDVVLTQNSSREVAEQVQNLLQRGISTDSIKSQINKDGRIKTTISSGIVEENYNKFPADFAIKKGVSAVYHNEGDSYYKVVLVKEILEPTTKSFDEATGSVLNDYQQKLEKEWEANLAKGHKVKVNKRTLKKVKKALAEKTKS